jgi:hypothetical protein
VNAELAQRIALVAHGNAFLAGLGDPPDLLADNSAFQYVRSVEFQTSGRSIRRVDLWLSALARRGARRLRVRTNDLAVEGDGLGEVWLPSGVLISKRFEERRQLLIQSFMETGVWNDEEQRATSAVLERTDRPWRLFFKHEPRRSRPKHGISLSAARAALVEAVTEAREFARQHRMGLVGWFDKSLALANSSKPVAPYHADLLPAVGHSLDARQVVAAAAQAWVFGPWGWSDGLIASDSVEAEFWRCDAKLRASVVEALIAATNSFPGSQRGHMAI